LRLAAWLRVARRYRCSLYVGIAQIQVYFAPLALTAFRQTKRDG
jgi:hypothetical protein